MGVSRIYRAFAPYPHTALGGVDYAQTADVVYTVHLDYPEYKASRTGHTNWRYTPVTYAPSVATPAAPAGAASQTNTTGANPTIYRYKISAVSDALGQESRPSAAVELTNDLTLHGNKNTLTMPAKAAGVDRFIVYKEQGNSGTFGYIGVAESSTFVDGTPQIQPVLSDTPPVANNPFTGAGMYPSTIAFHQQRKMLGRTRNIPNGVWGSQSSNFDNMDISRPAKPDDALSFALVGERVNSVNQLASLSGDLVVISSNAIYSVSGGGEGGPLTPSDILPKRQNSRSGGRLNPIALDDIIFYPANKGTSIRTLGFRYEIDGYQSNNITIFSPHFFLGHVIVDWAYVEEPYSAIFAVRDDGVLLCFTWESEQQVWGWTQLETAGKIKAVAVITEGGFDRLYAVIERVINGVTRKFHERLALPHGDDILTAAHLDCSVTQVYNPPRNVVGGLWHLEGATVSAYYDGFVAEGLRVTNGAVTLPNGYLATIATVGLPYEGEVETLPMVLNTREGSLHNNTQNIARVVVRAVDTRGIKVGITGTELEAIVEREGGEIGLPDVAHRDYEVTPPGHWEEGITLTIRQDQPLPAHITGIFVEPRISRK